ncbi:unnamed protein product [Leuciscus chuanchicus]
MSPSRSYQCRNRSCCCFLGHFLCNDALTVFCVSRVAVDVSRVWAPEAKLQIHRQASDYSSPCLSADRQQPGHYLNNAMDRDDTEDSSERFMRQLPEHMPVQKFLKLISRRNFAFFGHLRRISAGSVSPRGLTTHIHTQL